MNELYFSRDACIGKYMKEIYDKIGTPSKHIQLVFENEVCTEVRRIRIYYDKQHEKEHLQDNTNINGRSLQWLWKRDNRKE